MTAKPITSLTPGQVKQYGRFVEDAAEKALLEAGLDKEGLQKLLGNGGEFQADIIASIRRLSVSNQYANEEVPSSYGYLSGFRKPNPFTAQCEILRAKLGCEISFDESALNTPLVTLAEGNSAIPDWETVAPTYGEAVELVLKALEKSYGGRFVNYRDGQLGPQQLKQSKRSIERLALLKQQQKGAKILVVQTQFGLRHRGRSVRRAREVFQASEFGLGAFAVGCMLLTHENRLRHYDDLWPDCAGDEYAPEAGGDFYDAPFFYFGGENLEFSTCGIGSARVIFGSVSAFVPSAAPSE